VAENPTLLVDEEINSKLFDHQTEGIKFLYKNFKKKDGCILADDMGLGKTVQISVFLSTLKIKGLIKKALIVVPGTLIDFWKRELERWTPEGETIRIETA
jgi:SNF2 family DNA or RNA helicase